MERKNDEGSFDDYFKKRYNVNVDNLDGDEEDDEDDDSFVPSDEEESPREESVREETTFEKNHREFLFHRGIMFQILVKGRVTRS